ncbi:MAG: transcription antiterminator, partial [Clostridiales Family XIII bacterium]|nr:transcription antiterminator [Clostridiales Family XIII bacterium]
MNQVVVSPRLRNILAALLKESEPISVDRLAKELGSSRRTIFRELEGMNNALRDTGLELETIIGKGIFLKGCAEEKATLASRLCESKNIPQNKKDRQDLLAFLMMDEDEIRKMYYYAKTLDVSEATISLCINALEERLRVNDLEITRCPGYGIGISASEEDKRRAMVFLLAGMDNPYAFAARYGYPDGAAVAGMRELFDGEWYPLLAWVTDESLELLKLQLIVMIDRVKKRRFFIKEQPKTMGLSKRLADQLCDSAEARFSVSLPQKERAAVAIYIRACRAKQLSPLDIDDDAAYSRIQSMVYRMIDCFDPALSSSLKLNEDLVNGLCLHMWSAVIRLTKGIELSSAVQEQIRKNYPDVFEKSRLATKILEQEYGVAAPDSEVAFIASHFGAALMRIGERGNRNVVLRAGIICAAGIGVSYMMASQVQSYFKGELEVAIGEWNNPEDWSNFDLLISSIPLHCDTCPVAVVEPVLTDENYAAILRMIKNRVPRAGEFMPRLEGGLPSRLDKATERFSEISGILKDFCKLTIHANCSFDELAKKIGYRFGANPECGGRIYEDLTKREAISTQVIVQLGIILLHTRTSGLEKPAAALISPEGESFSDDYFFGAKG